MTTDDRIRAWQTSRTLADASAALGLSPCSATQWASRLRRLGVELRRFGRLDAERAKAVARGQPPA